jgi:hypothetical protein
MSMSNVSRLTDQYGIYVAVRGCRESYKCSSEFMRPVSSRRFELLTSYGTENVMKGLHVFGSHTYHGGAEWGILHWDVGCVFHSSSGRD